MLGATETLRAPDEAPDGILKLIDVPLHEDTVIADPPRKTALLPCELPKLVPVMVT
jgi:hypothetical protein